MSSEILVQLIIGITTVAASLIGIIPQIIKSRDKTEQALKEFQQRTDERFKELDKKVDEVSEKLKEHNKRNEWHEMKQRRVRILRFWDDILSGKEFSLEYWGEMMDDVNEYRKFFKANPDYENNKGAIAMDGVEKGYLDMKQKSLAG